MRVRVAGVRNPRRIAEARLFEDGFGRKILEHEGADVLLGLGHCVERLQQVYPPVLLMTAGEDHWPRPAERFPLWWPSAGLFVARIETASAVRLDRRTVSSGFGRAPELRARFRPR